MQPSFAEQFASPEQERGEHGKHSFSDVREILRIADKNVTEAKGEVESARRSVQENTEGYEWGSDLMKMLEEGENEIDAAWDDLKTETEQIEEGSAEQVEEDPDAIGNAMNEALSGSLKPQELGKFLKGELGKQIIETELGNATQEVFEKGKFDPFRFQRIIQIANTNPELKALVVENLSTGGTSGFNGIGEKMVAKLFDERDGAAHLESLIRAHADLHREQEPGAPPIAGEIHLGELVAIQEMLGGNARDFADALNVKFSNPELRDALSYENVDSPAITVEYYEPNPNTGTIDCLIHVEYSFKEPSGEEVQILRKFIMSSDPADPKKQVKRVEHSLLKVPPQVPKEAALVERMTKTSLGLYDKMGVDEIGLHANIDAGGYVWAEYGYGWDEDRIARAEAAQRKINMDQMTPEERTKIAMDAVASIAKNARNAYVSTLEQAGALKRTNAGIEYQTDNETQLQIENVLAAFDERIASPETTTPQTLARIGVDGPRLHKGESGDWYLEKDFQEALTSGKETSEDTSFRGSMHAGKLGLMGSSWMGKIDLHNTAQRELLEKRIDSRLNKKTQKTV